MKLGLVLVLLSLGACGGESFVSEPVTIAPEAGTVEDAPALPGVDAPDRNEAPPATPDVVGPGEAARDVLADPWPSDVEVVAVDAPSEADADGGCLNCMYRGDLGTTVCCNTTPGGCFGKLEHCNMCTCGF